MADQSHEPLPNVSSDTKVAILEERLRALREGIDKQAKEYERRLTELNHAHEKQVQDQATFVSNDRYEGWQGEMNAWRGEMSRKMSLLEGRSGGVSSVQGVILQVLSMLIALGSIIALIYVSGRTHP